MLLNEGLPGLTCHICSKQIPQHCHGHRHHPRGTPLQSDQSCNWIWRLLKMNQFKIQTNFIVSNALKPVAAVAHRLALPSSTTTTAAAPSVAL